MISHSTILLPEFCGQGKEWRDGLGEFSVGEYELSPGEDLRQSVQVEEVVRRL